SRGTNLYSLSTGDMMASSLICLLSKATKTKSWLWHRRLSHLKFGALNHLAGKAVRNIRTDNGTEFVNRTLRDYYAQVGISHETLVAQTPQQNGVIERQNHTLVEVARTMRPRVHKSVQHSKPKVAKSMTANKMKPGTSRGSDTLVAPSSSSLIDYRHGLVRSLPRLKFEKEHLCCAYAMGKSKKQSHKPKSEDTNHEKLYLLHMDLYGPMRVTSVNEKKYILVIVDDYSQFTWVKFLASKDEAPDFYNQVYKIIQIRLNAAVRNIRTDNGTEFVNQTLRDYYEQVGISHETSIARTPQQNGVIESALFYPNNDSENLCKLQAKADIASVASSVPEEEAPVLIESTGSPSSTTVDQDAPSPSTSQTTPQSQSQTIHLCAEEESHYLEVAHMSNDPYFGILIPKTVSEESSSSDVISTTVHSDAPISEHLMDTPMVEKSKLDDDTQGKAIDPTHYHGIVGTLMYLTSSRLDLVYAIQKVKNGIVELYFVRTEFQLVDIFTKALCRERIEFLIDKLGMRSFTLETLKELADEAEE
nr:retrovirus-related Pol polyprotein from transposon TNT 1-94 [Tanacetum cinerariifolium]